MDTQSGTQCNGHRYIPVATGYWVVSDGLWVSRVPGLEIYKKTCWVPEMSNSQQRPPREDKPSGLPQAFSASGT